MSSNFKGFFDLTSARGLREKLRRELGRLRASPLSSDAAFNFFVTAEHLLDWLYPKKAGRASRNAERKNSLVVRITSHLANGAKHFEVEDARHDSVAQTQRTGAFFSRLFPPRLFPARFFSHGTLVVRLTGEAAATVGETIPVVRLAEKVMEYWDKHAAI